MKIKIIKERKQLGIVYHFTTFKGITNILLTNEFQGSEANVDKSDKDFIAQGRDREEKLLKSKGIYSVYYFSTTRNKFLYKKNPSIQGSYVRLVLDGDKFTTKYPIKPYYFYHDEMMDEPNPKYDQDESEERILLGTKKTIPNAKSYIKEIQIILDVIQDNPNLLELAQVLINKYPNLIKFYYKEKEITLEDYKNNILPTIEPYRGEEIDEDDGSFEYRGGPILHENFTPQKAPLMGKFVDYTCNRLNIDKPKISIINSPSYSQEYHSFGGYIPSEQSIKVVVHNRNMADILRTLAHELVHHMQNINGEELNGEDGSDTENEANAMAGVIMREFGRENPEIFESKIDKGVIITCKNCGWHWPLAKGGNDPYICHKCGHDNEK
jgi:hypothetical protein